MRALVPLLVFAAASSPAALPPFAFGPIQSLADPAVEQPEIVGRHTTKYRQCLADPALNTYRQDQCNATEMARQDARLNETWRAVSARIAPHGKPGLRAAERAWIRAREQHCQLQAKEGEGGTIETLLYGSCMIDETIRRTLWLERLR